MNNHCGILYLICFVERYFVSILVWGKRELVALLCNYCVALPRGDIGMSPWEGGGGAATLIFSHIRRLGPYILGSKF